MKKLIVLFVAVFCLVSCKCETLSDYLVIDSYESVRRGNDIKVRYKCKVKLFNTGDVTDFYFTTDKQIYFVGDTVYFTKRNYDVK
jgi:hypothetical protein